MFKNKTLIAALSLAICINTPVFAQNLSLEELQDLPSATAPKVDNSKTIDQKHWAYKTLENLSKKYGLVIGKPGEKFDGNKPLTRNEAAVILVNLVGKIEQDQYQLNEAEKAKLEILKQELSEETQKLAGRVANLETSVDSLKGSVTKLEESGKKNFKYSYGENFQIGGVLQGKYTANFNKGDDNYASNFSLPLSEFRFSGKLHPRISYLASMVPSRTFDSAAKGILADVFVSTDIIPRHTIYFGQLRTPIGQEGTQSPLTLETVDRAQIARNFSNTRDIGVKVAGNWDFAEYYVGAFNGNDHNTSDTTNSAMDVGSWLVLKPFYKNPQLGNLEMGGGFYSGKNKVYSHNTLGFYGGYNYKKYAIKGEYSFKDGYRAANTKANGWYIQNTYFVTDKLQLLAKYDRFDPNTKLDDNTLQEYTFGGNYYLRGNNVKLQCNYVHIDKKEAKNSDRLIVQTQYAF